MNPVFMQNKRTRLLEVVPLSTPYTISIEPSGRCNFKCSFCPCNNDDFESKTRHVDMDFELFKKIVDDMSQFDQQIKVANLSMIGEPTLNPHFLDMIRLLRTRNVVRDIRTCTNGSLLNPDYNKGLIDASPDFIQLSVEAMSTQKYYDVVGVKASYETIRDNWEDLYKRSRGTRTKLGAKIIAANLNSSEIQEFERVWGAISDNCWWTDVYGLWSDFDNTNKTVNAVTDGKPAIYYESILSAISHICSKPLINLAIFADGDVNLCCGDWKRDTIVGNVRSESLKNIWNGQRMFEKRVALLKNDRKTSGKACTSCIQRFPDDIDEDADAILSKILKSKSLGGD